MDPQYLDEDDHRPDEDLLEVIAEEAFVVTNNATQEVIDDGKLISLVEQYPLLYDLKSKDYKNTKLKESCWEQIGDVMQHPAVKCMKRWLLLRDSFRREKKKRDEDSRSGSASSKRKGFLFFNNMLFLSKYIAKRSVYTNVSSSQKVIRSTSVTSGQPMLQKVGDNAQRLGHQGFRIPTVPSIVSFLPAIGPELATFHSQPSAAQLSSTTLPPLLGVHTPEEAAHENSQTSVVSATETLSSTGITVAALNDMIARIIPPTTSVVHPFSTTTCTPLTVTSTPSLTTPSQPLTTERASTVIEIPPQTTEKLDWTPPTPPMSTTPMPQLRIPDSPDLQQKSSPTLGLHPYVSTPSSTSGSCSPAPTSPQCSPLSYFNVSSPVSDLYADDSLSTYRESESPKIRVQKYPVLRNSFSTARKFAPYASSRQNVTSTRWLGDKENYQSEGGSFAQPKACFSKESPKSKKVDPVEASFINLSAVLQNRLQVPERTENTQKDVTSSSDQIFANFVASELGNMSEQQKSIKKSPIMRILYDENSQ